MHSTTRSLSLRKLDHVRAKIAKPVVLPTEAAGCIFQPDLDIE
jgi:hypothetical protein